MKTAIILLPTLVSLLGRVVAFDAGSLSGHIDEIPACALSAFAKAMPAEGCDTTKVDGSDIECLCKNAGLIARDVARDVEAQCALDFGGAVGKACGIWIALSSSATDFPRATSILGDKLQGKGGAATKTTDTVTSQTTSAAAAAGTTTTSQSGTAAATTTTTTTASKGAAAAPAASAYLSGMAGVLAAAAAALV
ncbi:hypothetical protein JDV02_005613 [Purpureocillium takamizusanense]|uniref:Extracellular membrane protein CFEM domain-containing protein n=1 Tax=Purpureocillium takamizusanense TaxID=2060973 RepID=A0A9Q8VC12_9HYPO|nr:uncharacterized protein JDV02_005613 [Purpureocillium takamizusanense]UNI19429.1 hypothetical protein JDV02_005613 [Purpureocillium takamizusanense]